MRTTTPAIDTRPFFFVHPSVHTFHCVCPKIWPGDKAISGRVIKVFRTNDNSNFNCFTVSENQVTYCNNDNEYNLALNWSSCKVCYGIVAHGLWCIERRGHATFRHRNLFSIHPYSRPEDAAQNNGCELTRKSLQLSPLLVTEQPEPARCVAWSQYPLRWNILATTSDEQ